MPKKTALYDIHKNAGAKLVEFAGFEMPIQYESIIEEHKRVRTTVGVFDVSHMGEFLVRGEDAEKFLNQITVNNVPALKPGKAQYTLMCYPDAGIVDDLLIYRFEDHFMTVVNASNIQKDWDWMQENLLPDAAMENISDETTLLAVQGPDSEKLLQKISAPDLSEIKFYNFVEAEVAGREVILSRTGYTGEPGFEIYADAQDSEHLWHTIFEAGKEYSVEPIGLGARDTLRLEAGLCLYGNDLTEHTNPIEAGLGWVVKPESGDFIGKDIIVAEEESGPQRKRVGFELLDRGIPRHGYDIIFSGRKIGEVTSGNQSPMLDKGIGMGYVSEEFSNPGTTFNVKIRTKEIPAKVVKLPFYKSTHK